MQNLSNERYENDLNVSPGTESSEFEFLYEDADDTELCPGFDLKEGYEVPIRNLRYKTTTDHLNCPICRQPFIEPLTTRCGHTFCKDCIYECIKMSEDPSGDSYRGACPLDRTHLNALNINDLFPTCILIKNLIDDCLVYCLNEERGCSWSGHRWEVHHHLVTDCVYTKVPCKGKRYLVNIISDESEENSSQELDIKQDKSASTLESSDDTADDNDLNRSSCSSGKKLFTSEVKICEMLVERRFLSDENNHCVHRLYSCRYCDAQVSALSETHHLNNDCLQNFKQCEICFNDRIPQKHLSKHEENCSKISKIKCPANVIGCAWVGMDEAALEVHLQNYCQLHQALPFMEKLNERVDTLEKENKFLQVQVNKILNSVASGKVTNLGYHEPLEEIGHSSSSISHVDSDRLIYLNYELDRLKCELEENLIPSVHKNRCSMIELENTFSGIMNYNIMMKDDLNVQRALVNSVRKQLQYLHYTRNPKQMFVSAQRNLNLTENSDLLDNNETEFEERLNLKL